MLQTLIDGGPVHAEQHPAEDGILPAREIAFKPDAQ